MNNKQTKKATVDAINVMIRHADKGPSGFWVEDHEGCGNPAVFPEFEEGLKRGRLIQEEGSSRKNIIFAHGIPPLCTAMGMAT